MAYLTLLAVLLLTTPTDACSTAYQEVVRGLPHVNRRLAAVHADLGRYHPLLSRGSDCSKGSDSDSNSNALCFNPEIREGLGAGAGADGDVDLVRVLLDAHYTSDPEHIGNYVDALGVWAAMGATFASLSLLLLLGFCCGRFCCCCVSGGSCGKRWPTVDERGYPAWQVRLAYALVGTFAVMVSAFVAVGQLRGNLGATSAQRALADAPQGVVDLMRRMPGPVHHALLEVVGVTAVQTLLDINRTVSQHLDSAQLRRSVDCTGAVLDRADTIPPYLSAVLDDLEGITVSMDWDATSASLSSLDYAARGLKSMVPSARADLGNLSDAVSGLISDVDLARAAVTSLGNKTVSLEANLGSVKTDLDKFSTGVPTVADVDGLVSAVASFRSAVDASSAVAAAAVIRKRLSDFEAKISTVPDLPTMGTHLKAFNKSADSTADAVAALVAALLDAQTRIDALPASAPLEIMVNKTEGYLDALGPSQTRTIRDSLVLVGDALKKLPGTHKLTSFVENVRGISNDVPCVLKVGAVVRDVNTNLVDLPPEADDLQKELDTLNSTVTNALTQLDQVRDQLSSLNKTLASLPNMTIYVQDVDRMETEVQDAREKLNFPQLKDDISDLDVAKGAADLSGPIANAKSLLVTLRDPATRPSAADVAELEGDGGAALEAQKASFPGNAADARRHLRLWEDGFCRDDVEMPCASSSECVGGGECVTAFAGQWPGRCMQASGVPGAECRSTSECTEAGTTCTAPDLSSVEAALSGVRTALEGVPSADVLDPVRKGVDAALVEIAALPDGAAEAAELKDLGDALASLPDLGKYDSDLATFQTELEKVPDTAALLVDFDSFRDEARKLGDDKLRAWQTDVRELNRTLTNGVPRELLADARDYLGRYEDFTTGDGPGGLASLTQTFGKAHLSADIAARGNQAALASCVDALRDTYKLVTKATDAGADDFVRTMRDAVKRVGPLLDLLEDRPGDDSGGARPSTQGALWQIFDVVARATDGKVLEHPTPASVYAELGGIPLVDGYLASGWAGGAPPVKYEGGIGPCITRECLQNTITYYNTHKVSIPVGHGDTFHAPLDRETLMFLPYCVPIVMVLLAVVAMLLRSRCAAMTLAMCSLAILPLLFLFMAIGFPLVVGTSDVCASAESIALRAAPVAAPALCASRSGMFEDATGACTFEVDALNATLRTSPTELLRSLLVHGCAGAGADRSEAVADLWAQVQDAVAPMARDRFNQAFDRMEALDHLRPALQTVLDNAVDRVGTDASTTVGALGGALDCASLHGVLGTVKSATCCEMGGSFYWYVVSWYWIGFCALFCGFPGGVLGYKRFVRTEELYKWHKKHWHSLSQDDDFYPASSLPSPLQGGVPNPVFGHASLIRGGQRQRQELPVAVAIEDAGVDSALAATSKMDKAGTGDDLEGGCNNSSNSNGSDLSVEMVDQPHHENTRPLSLR